MWQVLQDPTVLSAIFQVIGALLQALATIVAVVLAARWAFTNVKQERTFDRQLGWYERTIRVLR